MSPDTVGPSAVGLNSLGPLAVSPDTVDPDAVGTNAVCRVFSQCSGSWCYMVSAAGLAPFL